VLTDVNFFKGSIEYLREIAAFKSVPLLRKDFIIDEFQIYEAKSNGADAILLIAESLSKNQIAELSVAAYENDLEVLLELHSEDEIEKIDFKKNSIIGINNRNLKTFNVSLETTKIIGELIPGENLLVAESGMKNKTDIEYIKGTNAKAILVGEHLMLSNTLGNAVKELKEWCTIED
jgi:indole-3-glycerol phosphate synthase